MTDEVEDPVEGGWTGALRRRAVAVLPPEQLQPDRQPAYVSSWIYVFGVLTISAFICVLASGVWLAGRRGLVAFLDGRPLRELAASVER